MWEWVRKFGLEYCDLPSLIWNVSTMLRLMALKIEGGAKSIPKILYALNAAVAVCYVINYMVFILCFVLVGCRQTGDVIGAILVLSIGFDGLIGVTKLICMYLNQDKVQAAVAGYIAYDRLPVAPSTAGLMAASMRSVKKRAMFFWITVMGNAFAYLLQPLVMPVRHVLYDEHVLFGLKYIFGTSNYLLALVGIATSASYVCYVVSNVTSLLIVTAGYSEARMLALGQELRELWSDANQHYLENFNPNQTDDTFNKRAKEINKYVKDRLRLIAQSHAINIDLVNKLETIFRDALAAEFFILGAALIAELLGGLEQTYIILPLPLVQVTMDFYVGQKLMDANKIFENSVYDCRWENFDVHNMKTVLLVLRMSQKGQSLSARGLAPVDFRCLMFLYKSVYSAYTALSSIMKET